MVILLIISILLIGIGAGVYDSGSLGLGLFLFVVWLVVGWVKDANSPEDRKSSKMSMELWKIPMTGREINGLLPTGMFPLLG